MAGNKISWFYESASEKAGSGYEDSRSSFGVQNVNGTKTFDEHFEELCESYKDRLKVDIKKDMNVMMGDRTFMNQYKADLMDPVFESYRKASPGDPHVESVINEVGKYWDNKVKSYTESASITAFLPIATLEFPVLVKQFFSSVLKDIIEIESVKTPNIVKHIRTTYMVDNQTGEEYEYPKCLFDGTWEKVWDASKGHKIDEKVVPLNNGKLWNYDIIGGLTQGTPGIDKLSLQFKIIGIQVGGNQYALPGNGITIEFSTNGTLVNGDLDFVAPDGTHVEDLISGRVNFKNGTVSLTAANGQVTGVVFSGYLSNEKNLRTASVREKRDILRFTIEDGARWNMPFSMEEIEDAAALLDINYYNRMVDEIVRSQEMHECMKVIKFLNDEKEKFAGIDSDPFKMESVSNTYYVDLNPPQYFAGDPFKYISTAIQFKLKGIIHDITDLTKLDGLSFVLTGNPKAMQLITEFVDWKTQSGTSIGGIDVNNSYGFATDMGANVRATATNIYDAYTVDPVEETGERELVIHITGYPTDAEHISFRHLRYTSHLFTSQSQTAYQSTQAPGGAFNIVTATSRFQTMAVQGIQADLIMLNSKRVYGKAPKRPPIVGAPWNQPATAAPGTTPVGP